MSSVYAPPVHAHRAHVSLWLVAVIGLAAALVALGTWVLVDRYTGGDTATQDATTLIDDFGAASSAHNGEAAAALLTSDAVLWSNGATISGRKAIANEIATTPGLRVERAAPVTVEGEFASTFSTFSVAVAGVDRAPMITVYQLKDGKIFRLWDFAVGVTPPFDSVAKP